MKRVKKLLLYILVALFVLQLPPIGFAAVTVPNDLTGNTNFLVIHGSAYDPPEQSSSFKITQADGVTIIPPEGDGSYSDIPAGAKVIFDYAFHLEDGNAQQTETYTYEGDEFFTAALPEGLSFAASSGTIVATDAIDGAYTIALWSITGNVLRIELTNTGEDPSGKGGAANPAHLEKWAKIHIEGTFQSLNAGDDTATSITFGSQTIVINRQPLPMLSMLVKSGSYDASTNTITWTVTVTPPLGAPNMPYDGYSVIDEFGAGQAYVNESFTVNGDAVADAALDLSALGSRVITYIFPDTAPDTTGTQTVTYKTSPTAFSAENGAPTEFSTYTNKVNLKRGADTAADEASASVTLNWISKSGTAAGTSADLTIAKWTVSVTVPGQSGRAISGAAITDTIPADLELYTDVGYPVQIKFGAAAAADVSIGIGEGLYDYSGNILTYVFAAGSQPTAGTTAILTFYTRVKTSSRDTYLNSNSGISFSNSASLSWDENATGTVPSDTATINNGVASGGLLSKSAAGGTSTYVYSAADPGTIHWTITVNRNKISIVNAKVADTIPAGQQLLIDGSHPFTVIQKGSPDDVQRYQTTAAGATADFTSTDGFVNAFAYEIPEEAAGTDTINSSYTIDYYTRIVDTVPGTAGDATGLDTLYRNATVGFGDSVQLLRTGTTISASGTKNYSSQMIDKTVATAYDYNSRTIQWRIDVNRNKLPLTNAVVTDTLPVGMTLLIDGGHPFTVTAAGGATGSLTGVNGDTSFSYALTTPNADTYTITFWTLMDEQTLKTQWSGNRNFTNTASVDADEITTPISDGATAQIINPVIQKAHQYPAGADYINWSIVINPGQVLVTNGVVTDILNAALQLNPASLKLYTVPVVGATGVAEPSSSGTLVTEGYTVTLPTANNGNTLTVNLPASTSSAYRLEFSTGILLDDISLTNSVNLSGSAEDPTGGATSLQIVISNLYSSGGSGSNVLTVHKTDTLGNPLAGAQFRLLNVNRQPITSGGNPIVRTTNAGGDAVFNNLPAWVFYVEEINPTPGYLIPAENAFGGNRLSGTETITVANDLALTTVSFAKTGAGGVLLSGGTFTLTGADYAGNPVSKTASALNGTVSFTNVTLGSYSINETVSPDGHTPFAGTLSVTVAYNEAKTGLAVTVTPGTLVNTPVTGTVSFGKTGTGGHSLSGGTFTLTGTNYAGAAVSLTASAVNGTVSFANVPIGSYTISETDPPNGYLQPASSAILLATVAYNETYTALVTTVRANTAQTPVVTAYVNEQALGSLSFNKNTAAGMPLNGGMFTLTGMNYAGSQVVMTAVSVNGIVTFTDVPLGNNYIIRETFAPYGYSVTNTELSAQVAYTADKTGVVTSVTPDTLINTPAPILFGSITVMKTDEDGKKLAGATFELVNTANSQVERTAVSDGQGIALFDLVREGRYIIRERNAPDGYILSEQTISVKVDSTINQTFTMINTAEEKLTGGVSIIKTDDAGKALAGAEFTLYDESGAAVKTAESGPDGRVLFDDLPEGIYNIVETRAPLGYSAVSGGTKVKVIREQTASLAFINHQTPSLSGMIVIKKTGLDAILLPDAEFALYDSSGNVISKARTGEDGYVRFIGLAPGSYTVRETTAPEGYALYSEPLSFAVKPSQTLFYTLRDAAEGDDTGVLGWFDDNPDDDTNDTLPQTGGISVSSYMMMAGGFLILAGIKQIRRKIDHKLK